MDVDAKLDIVRLLIDHGADVHAKKTDTGVTSLMLACKGGHFDAFKVPKVLLKNRVNIYAKDKHGRSALDYARGSADNDKDESNDDEAHAEEDKRVDIDEGKENAAGKWTQRYC